MFDFVLQLADGWCSWNDNPVLNGLNVLFLVFCVTVRTNVLILIFFRCSLQSVDVFISGLISKCYWCGVWNLQWLLVDIGLVKWWFAPKAWKVLTLYFRTHLLRTLHKSFHQFVSLKGGFKQKKKTLGLKSIVGKFTLHCVLTKYGKCLHFTLHSRSYLNVCTFDHLCIFRPKMTFYIFSSTSFYTLLVR